MSLDLLCLKLSLSGIVQSFLVSWDSAILFNPFPCRLALRVQICMYKTSIQFSLRVAAVENTGHFNCIYLQLLHLRTSMYISSCTQCSNSSCRYCISDPLPTYSSYCTVSIASAVAVVVLYCSFLVPQSPISSIYQMSAQQFFDQGTSFDIRALLGKC